MSQGPIAARVTGDDYQGRFFWWQALQLLIPGCQVNKVVLEHDNISGFDDVVVFYDPSIKGDGGKPCAADYFQLKYHMNQGDVYSSDSLQKKKRDDGSSLFQKLFRGFKKIQPGSDVRLSLVSNVCWLLSDPLAQCIRHDGRLSDDFFSKGGKTAIGKCRTNLLNHLMSKEDLECDADSFLAFARALRLRSPFTNVSDLLKLVNAHCIAAGLTAIDTTVSAVVYDDLYRKLLQQGRTEFSADSLRKLCNEEKLISSDPSTHRCALGVRSFMRFAENMERECEHFECLCDLFDGRYMRDQSGWSQACKRVEQFIKTSNLSDKREYELLLECHLSLGYVCGSIVHRKSGLKVFPVQKGREGRNVWKPSSGSIPALDKSRWEFTTVDGKAPDGEIVLCLAMTHSIDGEVEATVNERNINPCVILKVAPQAGPSASSISGADEAIALAEEIQRSAVEMRKQYTKAKQVHIFAAAPVGLMFFLGQLGAAFSPVQLYEYGFDYDEVRWHRYEPSVVM